MSIGKFIEIKYINCNTFKNIKYKNIEIKYKILQVIKGVILKKSLYIFYPYSTSDDKLFA